MQISIENPQKRFDEHLKLPNNNRILFSGKFGTGKSYFLKEYFEQNKDKYCLFWISPIDYVVGANQDIFEWIKIDIAQQLLSDYLKDDPSAGVDKTLLAQTYIYNNAPLIVTKLLGKLASKLIEKGTGVDFLELYEKQKEDFEKFRESAEKEHGAWFKKLATHINESISTKGSIYEDDIITRIIRAAIENALGESNVEWQDKKEAILVIDDLDRLDPEHIFRILNILSAHSSHFDGNKFGFSKVLLVCDIENIEYIFEYRYGPKCDFEGYIEKYFTYEPFKYRIGDAISFFCEKSDIIESLDEHNKIFLSTLLKQFAAHDKIKVRNLKKIFNINISKSLPKREFENIRERFKYSQVLSDFILSGNNIEIDYNNYDCLKVIYILSVAFGGIIKLEKAIDSMGGLEIKNDNLSSIVRSLGIMSHLARYLSHEPDKAFYHIFQNNNSTVTIQKPITNFFSMTIELPLKWSPMDKYMGGDYFELKFPDALWYDLQNKYGEAAMKNINWYHLQFELKSIITFLKRENIFENMM